MVAVRSRQHAGSATCQPVARGAHRRKGRFDVCGIGPIRHYAAHQYRGRLDPRKGHAFRRLPTMTEPAKKPEDPKHPAEKQPLPPGLGQVMGVAGGLAPVQTSSSMPGSETSAGAANAPPPDLAKRLLAPRTA